MMLSWLILWKIPYLFFICVEGLMCVMTLCDREDDSLTRGGGGEGRPDREEGDP